MLFTDGAWEGYVNTGRIRDLSITRNGGPRGVTCESGGGDTPTTY